MISVSESENIAIMTGDFTADSIFDLVYSIPASRRNGAVFKMESKTKKFVSRLKDGNGRYLFMSGEVETLLGYPVRDLDGISSSGNLIQFGQFGYYADTKIMSGDGCVYCSRRPDPKYSCCPGCGAPR